MAGDDGFEDFYLGSRHRAVALVEALRRLPEPERLAIALHHLLDPPVAEVAARTGVPANTIRSRLVRGRRTLASLLGRDLPGEYSHA